MKNKSSNQWHLICSYKDWGGLKFRHQYDPAAGWKLNTSCSFSFLSKSSLSKSKKKMSHTSFTRSIERFAVICFYFQLSYHFLKEYRLGWCKGLTDLSTLRKGCKSSCRFYLTFLVATFLSCIFASGISGCGELFFFYNRHFTYCLKFSI